MPSQISITDWRLDIDADMVLRGQGADPEVVRQRKPLLVELAERAIREGQTLIAPAVLYSILAVEQMRHGAYWLSGGVKLSGAPLQEHLAPAQKIALIVCTLGEALEQRVSSLLRSDAPYAYALDGFGSTAVAALGVEICSRLEAESRLAGMYTSVPLSPGILGWPVDVGQNQVFSALDAARIGVSLNDCAQMFPHKSTSMILGISSTPFSAGRTCDFCNMKETCRYQDHAAFYGG